MVKKKILFVDDEPNILDGLRRMLRNLRNDYDMHFVGGGREALEMMAATRFDVVISDMRMPGMDGAELLQRVQKEHPHTIRMMLTGQADEESIMRTVGVVHQLMAKPCNPELLKIILTRTAALQDILSDGQIKDVISQIGALPSLPEIYEKLRMAITSKDVDINKVGKIIEEDMAMTAKVLQLVNSAFFGIFTKVDSPTRAVQLLGLDTMKVLVLGLELFSKIKIPTDILQLDKVWLHSLTVGKIARSIAVLESEDSDLVNNSFLAGTLHDIGKLILVAHLPAKYQQAIDLAIEKNITMSEAEHAVFGTGQSSIGAYLIGLWGFSNPVIEAICFHPKPELYPATTFTPTLAVYLANMLYYQNRPEEIIGRRPDLNTDILQKLGLQNKIEEWQNLARAMIEENCQQ